MIVNHRNFLSAMHGFWDNEVYCQPDMTSSWFLCQGVLQAIFHDGFWKSDHDFLIVFHSNFLSAMHGFRDNEVLLQAGYDVIVISPLGAFQAIFHDGFRENYHDFLMVTFILTQTDCKLFNIFSLHGISLLAVKYWGILGKMSPKRE